jgi:hypothetical protein
MTTDDNNPVANAPELSTPESDTTTVDNEQPDTDESYDSDSDLDTQGTDPEFEEVEFEGKKYSVPKEVRDALLRQADYTRKTQELAQTREQSQAEIAQEKARIQTERANIQAVGRLVALDDRLQQYQQVNWQQLSQEDPVRAQQEFFTFQQLKDARAGFVNQIQQHESQRAMQEQQETAKRLQQANEALSREIKGWSPEYAGKLKDVAKSLGASDDEIATIRSPWIVKALHAHKQLAEFTAKAVKAPAPPPAQPIRTVTGASSAKTDPNKMPIEDYMRAERKRLMKAGRL